MVTKDIWGQLLIDDIEKLLLILLKVIISDFFSYILRDAHLSLSGEII